MNWEGETAEAAWRVIGYDRSYSEGERRAGFNAGARWQRHQLRTDEAVERVAVWLFTRSWKLSIDANKGAAWWKRLDDEGREPWLNEARAAINALIGDET